jgi:hypothetical protein
MTFIYFTPSMNQPGASRQERAMLRKFLASFIS